MLGVWVAAQAVYLVIGDASPVAWYAHVGGRDRRAALCVPLKRRAKWRCSAAVDR